MSKEYIERKALMHDIMRTVIVSEKKKGYTNPELKGISKVIDRIKAQSTADVQEVRRGKNITKINPVDEFECSECGFICEICENIYDDEYTLDCHREYNPDFCPRCGAKMDKE